MDNINDKLNIEVGNRVFAVRKRLGYTREKLCELADISVQFLADIEKGRKTMTVNTLRRVAAALNVTTDYIVNGYEASEGSGENKEESRENTRISAVLDSLSPYNKSQAEKLLTLFAETVNHNK